MKRRDILLLLISSVILVVLWVIFSIIHQLVSSTINQSVSQAITPINPTFDVSVINTLKTRVQVAPDFSSFSSTPEGQPSPTPIAVPQIITPTPASPSAIPTFSFQQVTPTATPGGTTK